MQMISGYDHGEKQNRLKHDFKRQTGDQRYLLVNKAGAALRTLT